MPFFFIIKQLDRLLIQCHDAEHMPALSLLPHSKGWKLHNASSDKHPVFDNLISALCYISAKYQVDFRSTHEALSGLVNSLSSQMRFFAGREALLAAKNELLPRHAFLYINRLSKTQGLQLIVHYRESAVKSGQFALSIDELANVPAALQRRLPGYTFDRASLDVPVFVTAVSELLPLYNAEEVAALSNKAIFEQLECPVDLEPVLNGKLFVYPDGKYRVLSVDTLKGIFQVLDSLRNYMSLSDSCPLGIKAETNDLSQNTSLSPLEIQYKKMLKRLVIHFEIHAEEYNALQTRQEKQNYIHDYRQALTMFTGFLFASQAARLTAERKPLLSQLLKLRGLKEKLKESQEMVSLLQLQLSHLDEGLQPIAEMMMPIFAQQSPQAQPVQFLCLCLFLALSMPRYELSQLINILKEANQLLQHSIVHSEAAIAPRLPGLRVELEANLEQSELLFREVVQHTDSSIIQAMCFYGDESRTPDLSIILKAFNQFLLSDEQSPYMPLEAFYQLTKHKESMEYNYAEKQLKAVLSPEGRVLSASEIANLAADEFRCPLTRHTLNLNDGLALRPVMKLLIGRQLVIGDALPPKIQAMLEDSMPSQSVRQTFLESCRIHFSDMITSGINPHLPQALYQQLTAGLSATSLEHVAEEHVQQQASGLALTS